MIGYFIGLPQIKIAQGASIDQGSVSHYATQFANLAAEVGLIEAGKEYRVLDEVKNLRSLSIELFKSKLSVEEAIEGHDIMRSFLKLEVPKDKHITLIKVCKEISDPGFIKAALKLAEIETQTGMVYQQFITNYEIAQQQL
jgi:hypothetical protein